MNDTPMNDTAMTTNAAQIAYWNEIAGAKWVRDQGALDRAMAELGDALLAAAAPEADECALDIGCGCGTLALRLATAVGRHGHVTGIDVSRPMLARAAERTGIIAPDAAPLRWIEADAATYAFEPSYDLLASRFGVMFFDDPAAAFANLRRALKPGGRFACLAWRDRAAVEWMQAPLDWLGGLLPMPAPSEGEPGPFGLADAAATRTMLERAGFAGVTCERLDGACLVGRDPTEALALLLETGPAAAAIREAPEARPEAERRLAEALRQRAGPDGAIRLGAACWVYRGRA